ncbi:DNA cytosine methyltransferase [Akkermansiaceae bacterium]|nr:DNA cytosine methyltransferase [Akkermansiaceae bacterium]
MESIKKSEQANVEGLDESIGHQNFSIIKDKILREIDFENHKILGEIPISNSATADPDIGWFVSWLRGESRRWRSELQGDLRIMDMFSGAGGLSLGVSEAAKASGWNPVFQAALDLDQAALEIHRKNFNTRKLIARDVSELVDYQLWGDLDGLEFADPPEPLKEISNLQGEIDMIVAGPPCQGHSNLNNHTRRDDDRNRLYLMVPAFAAAVGAKIVVIENVQQVLHDKHNVVENAISLFKSEGYHVTDVKHGVLKAEDFGVAQVRRRHFIVASRYSLPKLRELSEVLKTPAMTSLQGFSGLSTPDKESDIFNSPAKLSQENQSRIDYLHDEDLYELPNHVRPDCHKDGHTYPSVYGRIYPDRPNNTITTGFLSPGRGRYIHPLERRAITPHEAARLQGFPDDFIFSRMDDVEITSKVLSKVIGDAVPPPMGFVPALAAILTLMD